MWIKIYRGLWAEIIFQFNIQISLGAQILPKPILHPTVFISDEIKQIKFYFQKDCFL